MPKSEQVKEALSATLNERGLPPLADPATLKRRAPPDDGPDDGPEEAAGQTGGLPIGVTLAMTKALRRAGWCAILGVGLTPSGPLRIAVSTDPAKTLREARMHNVGVGDVAVQMLLYVAGPEVAARIRDDVLDVLKAEGGIIRASLVAAGSTRLDGLVRMSAVRIGTDAVDTRTAAKAVEGE